jgi:hypothetical protein
MIVWKKQRTVSACRWCPGCFPEQGRLENGSAGKRDPGSEPWRQAAAIVMGENGFVASGDVGSGMLVKLKLGVFLRRLEQPRNVVDDRSKKY